ncbi:MAG: hypothetical protein WAV90_04040 [Gordonia amarae]
MSEDNGNIEIASKSGYHSALGQLNQMHEQIPDRESADAITTAAESAAKSGTSTAPVFTESISALKQMLGGIDTQITAAGSSVGTALSDLGSIADGLSAIDDAGADEAAKS